MSGRRAFADAGSEIAAPLTQEMGVSLRFTMGRVDLGDHAPVRKDYAQTEKDAVLSRRTSGPCKQREIGGRPCAGL